MSGGAEHGARIFGTEEDKVNCPFYFKIGACRHGDRCSRLHIKPSFSQTIVLLHMYQQPQNINNPAELQEHFEDFFEEVFDELAKYGELEEMNVCENLGDHMVGNIYVKYRTEEQAEAALARMQNRFYAGRLVQAEFSPVSDFREARCRQFDEEGCSRGGYCNFMHLRSIPRRMRKRLFKTQPHRLARKRRDNRSRSRSRSNERRPQSPGAAAGFMHGGVPYPYGAPEDLYRQDYDQEQSRTPVRESSEERRARIEQWNRERELQMAQQQLPPGEGSSSPKPAQPRTPDHPPFHAPFHDRVPTPPWERSSAERSPHESNGFGAEQRDQRDH